MSENKIKKFKKRKSCAKPNVAPFFKTRFWPLSISRGRRRSISTFCHPPVPQKRKRTTKRDWYLKRFLLSHKSLHSLIATAEEEEEGGEAFMRRRYSSLSQINGEIVNNLSFFPPTLSRQQFGKWPKFIIIIIILNRNLLWSSRGSLWSEVFAATAQFGKRFPISPENKMAGNSSTNTIIQFSFLPSLLGCGCCLVIRS